MRLLCFIDNLGPGGAQRQLCGLATTLKRRGVHVEMLVYREGGHFRPMLDAGGVPVKVATGSGFLARVLTVRRAIEHARPDVVLAFLPMPALYAELAGALGRDWGLVVGERSSTPDWQSIRARARRHLHRLADAVVANSHANRLILERSVPQLRGKASTIYNAVDFARFRPAPMPPRSSDSLHCVVAASYRKLKNVCGWIEAMRRLRELRPGWRIETDWYGGGASAARGANERELAQALAERYGLSDRVRLHDATSDIAAQYAAAHVVALPSYYEGLPNAVCEGMAMGRPVACSAVSDAGNLVRDGLNGVLFDPGDVENIAERMSELVCASDAELAAMGQHGIERAHQLLDPDRIAGFYEDLLSAAAERRRVPPILWPPEVPATAYATLGEGCAR